VTTQITFIVLGQLALIALVVVLVSARLRDRERMRMEMQGRLIDRFASPAELQQFIESEGGRRLLETLDPARRGPSVARIVVFVQAGLLLGAVGAALLLLVLLRPFLAGALEAEDTSGILVAAIVVLSLAGGLLLAAAVSRRLSRRWGADRPPAEEDQR
jgi:hypothetical protein